jgi:cobalt-zinc-cadmium efflux system protein
MRPAVKPACPNFSSGPCAKRPGYDVGALALSLFVAWFSRQPATPQKTYGYLRWEILAAFINGAVLLLASAVILWESVQRLAAPEPVQGGLMLGVAVTGLLVNAFSAWLLHGSAGHSINVRAAYLHVLGDLLGSVAAIVAAVLVRWQGWLRTSVKAAPGPDPAGEGRPVGGPCVLPAG